MQEFFMCDSILMSNDAKYIILLVTGN